MQLAYDYQIKGEFMGYVDTLSRWMLFVSKDEYLEYINETT